MTKDNDENHGEDGDDDNALWQMIARTVKPLRHKNKMHPAASQESQSRDDKEKTRRKKPSAVQAGKSKESGAGIDESQCTHAPSPPSFPAMSQESSGHAGGRDLDKRLNERLRRGQVPIDMRIDLHGHTQQQALHILETSLKAAHKAQTRCVLVVTGKGKHSPQREGASILEPGILKQNVPLWLDESPLRDIVLKTHTARPKDGGGGAFYVLLRRRRG